MSKRGLTIEINKLTRKRVSQTRSLRSKRESVGHKVSYTFIDTRERLGYDSRHLVLSLEILDVLSILT